jgi:hypothetical protein
MNKTQPSVDRLIAQYQAGLTRAEAGPVEEPAE